MSGLATDISAVRAAFDVEEDAAPPAAFEQESTLDANATADSKSNAAPSFEKSPRAPAPPKKLNPLHLFFLLFDDPGCFLEGHERCVYANAVLHLWVSVPGLFRSGVHWLTCFGRAHRLLSSCK